MLGHVIERNRRHNSPGYIVRIRKNLRKALSAPHVSNRRAMKDDVSPARLLPLQTTLSAEDDSLSARRVFYFVHMNTVYAHMKQQLLLYRSNDKFL